MDEPYGWNLQNLVQKICVFFPSRDCSMIWIVNEGNFLIQGLYLCVFGKIDLCSGPNNGIFFLERIIPKSPLCWVSKIKNSFDAVFT